MKFGQERKPEKVIKRLTSDHLYKVAVALIVCAESDVSPCETCYLDRKYSFGPIICEGAISEAAEQLAKRPGTNEVSERRRLENKTMRKYARLALNEIKTREATCSVKGRRRDKHRKNNSNR